LNSYFIPGRTPSIGLNFSELLKKETRGMELVVEDRVDYQDKVSYRIPKVGIPFKTE
jgi:hypothetical protein